MIKTMISVCPRCARTLKATRLSCDECMLELAGDFPLTRFDQISPDDLAFLEVFLKTKGNFKTIQKEEKLSYQKARKKYGNMMDALGLAPVAAAKTAKAPKNDTVAKETAAPTPAKAVKKAAGSKTRKPKSKKAKVSKTAGTKKQSRQTKPAPVEKTT